jgi:hydroxymethylglutaryl-CoA synthase
VLLVSYGSGAGSDAFSLVVTEQVTARRLVAPITRDYIMRRKQIDYATYARFQGNFRSN